MGAEVDSLEISIKSSVDKATQAIDRLIGRIGNLANAMNFDFNSSGMDRQVQGLNSIGEAAQNVSRGMESLRNSMEGISGSSVEQFGQITRSITRLANAGERSTEVANSLPQIGLALRDITADMSGIGAIDSGVNRFTASIARLANAGDKSTVVANELPRLGDALRNVAEKMTSVEGISDSTNVFTQAIAQLANAGDRAGRVAPELGALSQSLLEFFNTMRNAPEISENTIRMTQSVAQLSMVGNQVSASIMPANNALRALAETAGRVSETIRKAMRGLARIVTGTFSKIAQIGIQTANTMRRVAGSMMAAFAKITHSSKGLNTATSNLKNLFKAIIGYKGILGLVNFGKQAMKLGSDITEVENVVDVAFGSMAKQAYDFASTATEQFGLSELAAKQYSGTMMAMLKSSGVAQAQAAEMSTTLAGLAGDIASFYNIETDEAFYKLRSAIAGQTMPMRSLGVNMNIVNLEAFAMSKGINKAYREMTLAEQATLRYEYILAKTTDAQGDFARTSGTYANQVRLLKLNFQSLSAVIGQGLIAAILPAIKWLNALMSKLMGAAKTFRDFMYVLVGKKAEFTPKGVVNDLAGIGSGLESIGDSAEEAGKKLKNKLFTLPFDELNILADTSEDLSNSLEDIGNIDTGLDGMFDDLYNKEEETPINKWAQRIRDAFLAQDWEELGKTIAEMVNIGLQKVYDAIVAITPKVEQALKAFARVFNSFVEWLDWDLLGRTVGAGINLLVKAFNALFGDEGIDLENLGRKLSVGFRGLVDEVNWAELGNALGNGFMIAWRLAEGFIEEMWRINPDTFLTGWAEVGIAIAETLYGIFQRIDFGRIGATLANGFNGIFEIIRNFNEKMADDGTWQMIADNISSGLNNAISGIRPVKAAEALGRFAADLLGTMLKTAEETPWEELGKKVGQFLANIPWSTIVGQMFGIVSNVFGGFFGGLAMEILSHFGEIGTALANGFNNAFERLRNFTNEVPWGVIADDIYTGLNNMIHGIRWVEAGKTLSYFAIKLLGVFREVSENTDWKGLGAGIGQFLSSINWQEILGRVFDIIKNTLWGLIDGLNETAAGKIILGVGAMVAGFEGLSKILPVIDSLFGDNGKIITVFKSIFGEEGKIASIVMSLFGTKGKLVAAIVAGIAALAAILAVGGKDLVDACFSFISGLLESLIEAVHNADWANVWHNIVAGLGAILSNSAEIIGKIIALAIELVSHLVAGLVEYVISGECLEDLAEFGLNLILGIVKGIMSAIGALADAVKAIFVAIWEGLKELFDINSPSKVMEELGVFIMQGLINGIMSLVDFVAGIFTGLVEAIKVVWTGLSEFLGALWGGIRTVAEFAWNGITEFLQGAWNYISETAITIWNGISEFFFSVWNGIQEVTDAVWNGISGFLKNIWNVISKTATTIWNAVSEFFSGICDEISKITEKIWNGISEFLGEIWNFIKDNAETIMNAVSDFFKSVWDGIKSTAEEIWRNISDFLKEVWEGIQRTAEDIWNTISDFFKGIWEGIWKTAEDIWNGITGFLEDAWNGIKSTAEDIWNKVSEFFEGVWNGIKDTAEKAWESISASLQDAWNGIKDKATEIWDGIKGFFEETWDSIKSTAEEKWEDIKDALRNIWEGIKDTAKSVAEGIGDFFAGAWDGIKTKAKDAWNSITDSMGDFANNAYNKVKDVPDRVYTALKETGGKMKSAGENLISGVVSGIKNTAGRVYDAISSVAGNMVSSFKNKLGIHSPSKVFLQLAEYTMQGFINGVDAGKRNLLGKMSEMAESISKPFENANNILGEIGENSAENFLGGMGNFMASMSRIGKDAAYAFSDAFNGDARISLMNGGGYSIPSWETDILPNKAARAQFAVSEQVGGKSLSVDNQYIMSGIEEASYRGFARANAENRREEDLLEEILKAVREGKQISIDGRTLVSVYDSAKRGMGWNFSG